MFYVKKIKMSFFIIGYWTLVKKTKVYKLTFPRLIFKILPLEKKWFILYKTVFPSCYSAIDQFLVVLHGHNKKQWGNSGKNK